MKSWKDDAGGHEPGLRCPYAFAFQWLPDSSRPARAPARHRPTEGSLRRGRRGWRTKRLEVGGDAGPRRESVEAVDGKSRRLGLELGANRKESFFIPPFYGRERTANVALSEGRFTRPQRALGVWGLSSQREGCSPRRNESPVAWSLIWNLRNSLHCGERFLVPGC